jgi:hypothetical protein
MSELSYQQTLICELVAALKKTAPFNQLPSVTDTTEANEQNTEQGQSAIVNDADAEQFIAELIRLSKLKSGDDDAYLLGQNLLCKLVMHYPHATHLANRDLFWFFAGDCLHYLSDEEINAYQIMDELRFPHDPQAQPPMDREQARLSAFNTTAP